MPQAVPVVPARRSRVLIRSLAVTFAGFAAIAGALAFSAKDADAAIYTLTTTSPTTNWSNPGNWVGGPLGTYPGQSAGDTAVIALNGFSLNIDVAVANPVALQITASSVSIGVPSGSSLLLASGSSGNSANSITINGGTFGVASGNTVSSYDIPITVNSGTFNVAGALSINTGRTLKLSGGTTQGGGTLTIPSGAVLLIDCTSGNASVLGTTVSNAGTLNYTCGSPLVFSLGTGSVLNNSGTLSLQTDQSVSGDALSSVNNSGTISKSGGTSTTFVPAVNNSGTLDPGSATIALSGGGTHTGAFTLASSTSKVAFSGGTHNLNAGASITAGAAGGLALTGGALNLNTPLTVPTMSESGGNLGGTQTLTAGTLNWTGGTMSGSGTTSVTSTAFLNGSSATTLNGWTLTNNGTVHYGPSAALAVNSGATVNNNGTWALESGTAIFSDLTGSPKFVNAGTLSKSIGGNTSIGAPLTNTGSVSLSGGSVLQLTGGGTLTGGSITTNVSSDELNIETNNVTIATTAPAFNGPGFVGIDSLGTLTNNVATSIPNLELDATGTLAGSGSLTINKLKWTGGTMTGSGTTVVTGTGNLTSATAQLQLSSGRTFLNNGTVSFDGSQLLLFLGSPGATFTNAAGAIFDYQGNGAIGEVGAGHLFNNLGTVKKSGGAGTSYFSVDFTNAGGGLVDSQTPAGTIAFSGLSSQMTGGTLRASNATATVDFPSGNFTISGGALAGSGPIRLNGGVLYVNSSVTPLSEFDVSGGQLAGTGSVIIPNGGLMKWTGGTIAGSASFVEINSGGDFQADSTSSSLIFNGRTLLIDAGGNAHWNAGTNSLIFGTNSAVSNLGTFTVGTNGTIGNGTAGTFSNAGTFKHTGTGRLTITMPVSNSTGGTWSEQGGTTIFASTAGVTHTGSFDAQSGTVIAFSGGTHNFAPGAAFSAGTGIYKVAGATMSLATNLTAPNFRLFSGTLLGTGDLTTTSTFTWDGGQMGGSGTTIVASGTATLQAGALTLSRNLTLSGNTSLNAASSSLIVVGPAAITNNATFTVLNGDVSCICSPSAASFVNNGTLEASVSPVRTFGVPISGAGAMNMASGWLVLSNGATFNTAAIASGAILQLGGTTSIGSVSGSGRLLNIGGTTTVSGAVSLPAPGDVEIQSGTLTLNGTTTTGTLDLKGGLVTGSGNITADGLAWFAGALGGSGTATINSTPVIQGSTGPMTLSRPLICNGPFGIYSAPSAANALTVVAPGSITNNGSFQIASDFDLLASGAVTFTNNGTLTRTSTATSNFAPAFTNAGTAAFGAGTTNFPNGYTQTAGTTTLGAGNLAGSAIAINGGILNGNGTITGPVTNAAALNPGTSPGSITIAGNYTQTASGVLNVDLNGTTPGTQYDRLAVTGNATLAGTLNATLGYTPANGAVFDTLTIGGTRSGDFAAKNLPTFPGGGTISASYVSGPPQALRLTAATPAPAADVAAAYLLTPSLKIAGQNATFYLNVTNNGPNDAANVAVTDTPPPGFTFVSNSGGCTTAFPCNLGTLAAGQTVTIASTYAIPSSATGTLANSASVSSSTSDPNTGNNSATFSFLVGVQSDLAVTKTGPAAATPNQNVTYDITVANNGPSDATGVSLADPTPSRLAFVSATGACTSFPCALGSLPAGQSKVVHATYTVTPGPVATIVNTATVTSSSFDTVTANNSASASTSTGCGTTPANLLPADGVTNVPVSGQLRWNSAGAASYNVYFGPAGSGCQTLIGTTQGNTFPYSDLTAGAKYEWRVEAVTQGCATLSSACVTFAAAATGCTTAPPPSPAVVGSAASGQLYSVLWDAVDGASRYEVDEATKDDFSDARTTSTTATHVELQHSVTKATAFYYRVRSFSACDQKLSASSATLRTVILPLAASQGSSANVPADSTQIVLQVVHVDGFPGASYPFTAAVDKPWLSVAPQSGVLPPAGLDFQISADPSTLPNGTATGTLILTLGSSSTSRIAPNGATAVSVPVSVNLVTPVSPATKTAPPPNALIIPSVGHLDGVNSQWQSDIRVTNASNLAARYQLTFTPSDTTQSSKSTTINVAAGDTTALDDIVRNWYGSGTLGDGANGVLEIRPLDNAGSGSAVNITTVASSRTYNVTANGTLGQFIPAIPFASFIGKSGAVLGLQQIAQTANYRTNFGVVEAGGKTALVQVTGYAADGTKLFDTQLDLKANEQRQINAFLASQGISELADGRLEVKVLSGDGKITAYASLIDNRSGDPLLISGVPLGAASATRYVLPGVADLSNGLANWRSDVRIFNAGTTPQTMTLTFYPLNLGGEPTTATLTIDPRETKQLDALLANVFHLANTGGALHVTTPTASQLVVTGRTYNLAGDGSTYGQFIPAVSDGVGKGGSLNVLQVEDSVRYRTNLGIAEVAGQPVTVEVTAFVPDSKVAPKATLTLQPFEYRQYDILRNLGLENVYNARIAIRVLDGDGRITAYGSVIDMRTQDPTYVPAQ